jgi:hypothetical protein
MATFRRDLIYFLTENLYDVLMLKKQFKDELNRMIDSDEIHTAGWMPGSNWMGTVIEPIYHACGRNQTQAALFFGLIVYKVFMERPDAWACGRFQLNGKDIKSLTNFRVKPKL